VSDSCIRDSGVPREKGACLVQIWVCESDVVVASDAVAEGREALVDPLDDHLFRQAVLQVLELCGHEGMPCQFLSLARYKKIGVLADF
jgi:hypothetical protein